MTGSPEDRDDLDDWLRELGGTGKGEDDIAAQLRDVVLRQQGRNEAGIDDIRLRKARDRLLAQADRFDANSYKTVPNRYFAIAASVAVLFTAGLFGYQAMFSGAGTDYELLMSYGDLERPRGAVNEVTADVDDPETTGRLAAERLTAAMIPFELRSGDGDNVRLVVTANDEAEVTAVARSIDGVEVLPVGPGYYVIILQ